MKFCHLRIKLFLLFLSCWWALSVEAIVRFEDLRVLYDFNETSGTVAKDGSGNDRDGTLDKMDGAAWVTGKFRGALSFDGVDDSLIIPPSAMVPGSETEVSVAFWAFGGDKLPSQNVMFATNGRGIQTHLPWSDGMVYWDSGNGGYDRINKAVPAADFKGKWTHWVFTKNRTTTSMKFFLDGVEFQSGNNHGRAWPNATSFRLGSNTGGTQNWHGIVDDFRVYGVELTSTDVEGIYNDGQGDIDYFPEVTLTGEAFVRVAKDGTYTEQGATATDLEDGDLTEITITYQPLFFVPSQGGSAEEVSGVSVKDVISHWGPRTPERSIDGSGLVDEKHDADTNNMWLTDQDDHLGYITYDLGTWYSLSLLKIWNYNELNQYTKRSIQEFELLVDDDPEGGSFTSIGNFTLDESPGTAGYDGQILDLVDHAGNLSAVRLLKINILSNYGDTGYTGISEIKFLALPAPTFDTVDTSLVGDWRVAYSATDSNGQTTTEVRTVRVFDPTAPVISLVGEAEMHHELTAEFVEPGYSVKDHQGGDLDASEVTLKGTVDGNVPGVYILEYDYTDADGLPAETVFRTVTVSDTTSPELNLVGGTYLKHQLGQPFEDIGATATDNIDGELIPFSSLLLPNQIQHSGYYVTTPEAIHDLHGNGGLFAETPIGSTFRNQHLYLNGDTTFRNAGVGINRNDWYSNLFTGYFLAKVEGTYQFGIENPDDRGSFWLDRDQDGLFEKNAEWMNYGTRGGYRNVTLTPGFYRFAITHTEYGGGSRIDARFLTPLGGGPTNRVRVNPSGGEQKGLWYAEQPLNTSVPGLHEITYTATDAAGNETTVVRTVEVIDLTDRPVLSLEGRPILKHPVGEEYTDPGATVADAEGNALDANDIIITGSVNPDVLGKYYIHYRFYDDNYVPAEPVTRVVEVVDNLPPVITLEGDAEIEHVQGQPFTDPGVTVTDNFDTGLVAGSTATFPRNNLVLHLDAANIVGASPGEVLTVWPDVSGSGNHLSDVRGDPTLVDDALNGRPVVRLDGNDFMANAASFDVQRHYSIFTVSQLEGTDNEILLSSRDTSWFLGYALGRENMASAEGEVSDFGNPATNSPHLYSMTSTGASQVRFYADGQNRTLAGGRNGRIIRFQVGGLRWNEQAAKGDVAEVLLYNNYTVTEEERLSIEARLAVKYGLMNYPEHTLPDLDEVGEHQILYVARDKAGNLGFATRKVTVTPDPAVPIIVLEGESEIHHEAAASFTDPGATVTNGNNEDLDETDLVVTGTIDPSVPGLQTLTYNYTNGDGLSAEEVVRTVIVADTQPPIITINGEAIVRLNIGDTYTDTGATANDVFDGEVVVKDNTSFDSEGLVLHLDAESFRPDLTDGEVISIPWLDQSAMGNHANNLEGDPTWLDNQLNGHPVVNFDGDDMIWTTKNFEPDLANYSLFTVARYTGGVSSRIFSSRGRNWLFGFASGKVRSFHSDGWAHNGAGGDNNWHIHFGSVNNRDQANFWLDGTQLAKNSSGLHNTNYKPKVFQIGGWEADSHMSNCEVAEVLLFDRVISDEERAMLQAHLNSKYDLNGGGNFKFFEIDSSSPSQYTIEYKSEDAAGNTSVVYRTIIVAESDDQPYLLLNGEPGITLEAGTISEFEDPGANAYKLDGTLLQADIAGQGDSVDPSTPGTYNLVYVLTDGDGNEAEPLTRTVTVVDTQGPVITLDGDKNVHLLVGNGYVEAGFSAGDINDGETNAFSDISAISGALHYHYFIETFNAANLNFDNNGGVLALKPEGTTLLLHGPDRGGMFFATDNDFRSIHPSLNLNDRYQTLFIGNFTALREGEYHFQTSQVNDHGTIWLDKDQDTIFERTGELGDERLTWGNQTTPVYLYKGTYRVIIAHAENTGGNSLRARFSTPPGAGPEVLTNIQPAAPEQAGIWSTLPAGLDTSKPGRYAITYYSEDKAGNLSKETRTVVVEEDLLKPVLILVGNESISHEAGYAYNDPGIFLEDHQGNPLDESQVKVTGLPDGMQTGAFTIHYEFTDADGHRADPVSREVVVVDTIAPVITLNGSDTVTVQLGQAYVDAGASALDRSDGELPVASNAEWPMDGLVLHLDAASFAGNVADGEGITIPWNDTSGQDNHADNIQGTPLWNENYINGHPAVQFNGNSWMWTTKNFEEDLDDYTVISIARYREHGHPNNALRRRVITSVGRNWLFGFYNGSIRSFYAEGWTLQGTGYDINWHLHVGDANRHDYANFWLDGNQLLDMGTGQNDVNYKPRDISVGGRSNEPSKCDVAEVFLFDRILTPNEHLGITTHLNSKYNLNGGGDFLYTPVDTSSEGEKIVNYYAKDSSGNVAMLTRKVIVVDSPTLPVITLVGDAEVTHATGQPYEDAGATVADGDGNALDASQLVVINTVEDANPGTYTVTFDFEDGDGNAAATIVRKVHVVDGEGPVITLVGGETYIHQLGNEFIDPGFTGMDAVDGEVQVNSSALTPNRLRVHAYLRNNGNDLILVNEGGLLAQQPVATRIFINGMNNQGVYLNGDGQFRQLMPEINRNDSYSLMVEGHFHTRTGGIYQFGMEDADDKAAFWLDLDQDGVFEDSGDYGSELMNQGYDYGYQEVELSPGFYRVAMAHREGTGGSRIHARYRAIQGEGPAVLTNVRPGSGTQAGQWVLYDPILPNVPGEQQITYTAVDLSGNETTIVRTVIVKNNPEAALISLLGEEKTMVAVGEDYVEPGVTITDLDGNELPQDNLSVSGEVHTDRLGEYVLEYNYTNADGVPSRTVSRTVEVVDTVNPIITLAGDAEVTVFQGGVYVEPGVSAADNYDGTLTVGSSELVPVNGKILHLDASRMLGVSDGDPVEIWRDVSGLDHHADVYAGTPTFKADAINGRPGVHFDGLSRLSTSHWFGTDYTILTVSQLTGESNQRLLSSRGRNWLLGYHAGFEDRMHPNNGWVTATNTPATTEPHVYSATGLLASRSAEFFADGKNLTAYRTRPNSAFDIGHFQMGAYGGGIEAAAGDVSEVLIYNHRLSETERLSVEAQLNGKYGLNGVSKVNVPIDTNNLGEYHVVYQTVDGSGNLASVTRKVTVVPDPTAPLISLLGEAFVVHEAGESYVDASVILKDADGNELDVALVEVDNPVDESVPAQYTIRYNYHPVIGNSATEVTRTVLVKDTQAPVITLQGDKVMKLKIGDTFTDPGATALDQAQGEAMVVNDLELDLNRLKVFAYKQQQATEQTNLDQNGGLLDDEVAGTKYFIDGPDSRGFD